MTDQWGNFTTTCLVSPREVVTSETNYQIIIESKSLDDLQTHEASQTDCHPREDEKSDGHSQQLLRPTLHFSQYNSTKICTVKYKSKTIAIQSAA
jgi:hypothetical protein